MIVRVPISVGELVDKLSILSIKAARVNDPAKLVNINIERDLLTAELQTVSKNIKAVNELQHYMEQLGEINRQLWDIEDQIRQCERDQNFEETFINLARNVYHTNDKRSAVKKSINLMVGSTIIEEKSYTAYQ